MNDLAARDDGGHPQAPTEPREAPLFSLRDVERRHIERVLEHVGGNRVRAAEKLGISRWALARRLRKYGIPDRP